MAINLTKGQKIDLTKTNPTVTKFVAGLGWNPNGTSTGGAFDLDVSAFMLGANGKLVSENHMVFYGHLKSPNDGLVHNGDNRTGDGDGDDESLTLDISKVEDSVEKIVFVVTIHEGIEKNQNFGQVNGSYIRILNAVDNSEIMKYDLNEDYSVETALNFGNLYKKDGEWKFEAVGTGMKGGLQDYLNIYQ